MTGVTRHNNGIINVRYQCKAHAVAPRWGQLSVDCYMSCRSSFGGHRKLRPRVGGPVGLAAGEQALDGERMSLIKFQVTSITTEHAQRSWFPDHSTYHLPL
jgi:hypothetical protein